MILKLPEKIKVDNNESYTIRIEFANHWMATVKSLFTMEILSRWQKERYPNHMMIALACM